MKCHKCGNTNIKDGQKFCTKCGCKLPVDVTQPNNKGFFDNVTHLGTFMERGSRGVQTEIRKEEQQRLQQQAQEMGLEVVKPQNGQQTQISQPQVQEQPQERRLVVDTDSIEGVNIVSGRAIWDIQKGQIARLVTETEFANAAGLKGVIVQEGCTAMVFIDGKLMSMMQAGCYTFPAKTEAELQLEQRQKQLEEEQKELDKQQKALEEEQRRKDNEYAQTFAARGVFGEIAAFGRGVMNFLFGKKKDDTPEQHKKKQEQKVEKLRLNPSPKVCRVYIVSNRIINLLFGSQTNADGVVEFVPMLIPTKVVDVNIAVSMQLQISNLNLFVTNYLADKKSMSVIDVQNELVVSVKSLLTQMLRNLDYQADGLPEPIVNNLKNRLQATCNERLQGIEVVRVMDITDNSADFERFRAVERELFASEKELGFLQRTNEFRNRLEQEQNKRTVDAAGNAEQLRQSLQAINKDKLLSEDEMEQFVMLLESQKRLREATTEEQEHEALQDLKKNRLVKDDDVAALENTLAQGKITRESVTEIMRVQASQKLTMAQQIAEFELSDSKMEHDMAAALRQAQHQGNLTAAQLDAKRLVDAYNDERSEFDWQKQQREREASNQQALFEQQLREQQAQAEYSRQRQDKFDDIDILERKARIAQMNMQAMKDAELAAQREQNRSAESLASMQHNEQMNRDNMFANMSAEQIRAAQLSHLTDDAQVAMAQSYSSEKENELRAQQQAEQKALYEQMMANQNAQSLQQQQMMMQMAQMMQQGMMGVAGQQMQNQQQMFQQQQAFQQQRYEDQQARANEYREDAYRQQSRMDHTQDQAFGAIGGVASAAASNLGAFSGGIPQQGHPQAPQPIQPTPQQPQGRICPSCGTTVPDGEIFCGECGTRM